MGDRTRQPLPCLSIFRQYPPSKIWPKNQKYLEMPILSPVFQISNCFRSLQKLPNRQPQYFHEAVTAPDNIAIFVYFLKLSYVKWMLRQGVIFVKNNFVMCLTSLHFGSARFINAIVSIMLLFLINNFIVRWNLQMVSVISCASCVSFLVGPEFLSWNVYEFAI